MMCAYFHCYYRRWPDNWCHLRSATAKEQADMSEIAVRQATERRQRQAGRLSTSKSGLFLLPARGGNRLRLSTLVEEEPGR
jgi:hypothetical protein